MTYFKSNNILILDCNFLCHRAMEMLKGLSYEDHPTGVVYGFMSQVQKLAERFDFPKFVFTWDSARSFRKEAFPGYKNRKPTEDPELEQIYEIGKPQFNIIRLKVLPTLGFKNIFLQLGLEADDLIASFIDNNWDTREEKMIVVSRDNDLLQLLRDDVSIFDPISKTITTEDDFVRNKGIDTKQWVFVKAVGGCSSDTIPGCKGIGKTLAIQYLQGTLTSKKRIEMIKNFDPTLFLSLVKLPHEKTKPVFYSPDSLRLDLFESVCIEYGFNSFMKKENYNIWRRILSC